MLTHVDKNKLPTMVDISQKEATSRTASAETSIQLPEEIRPFVNGNEIFLKKGPVIQTAIIAGTMAVKKTSELIPFCHHVAIESCKFEITLNEMLNIKIVCFVKTFSKTGVEMEALQGALSAALTIYDMCKAMTHKIIIGETKLIFKTGGKKPVFDKPLYGLVLTGGKSLRMKKDKALINYHGRPQALHIHDQLTKYCDKVFISSRKNQWNGKELESLPFILDAYESKGPIAGILSALEAHKDVNWFVVACDLVYFNEVTIEKILNNYDPDKMAIAYRNIDKEFPEPLCTLYTPLAARVFKKAIFDEISCPVKILLNSNVKMIDQSVGINLANINTTEEYNEVINERN